ncbi:MAG: glycosyltransferase family 2 protein, partial [Chlamydiia bacterium]|nr:glycosyltransferase family 2 protein [Chlamydiia bacterium]
EDKHFTFIVLTHNDEATIEKNLSSIQSQKYQDVHVYYLDQNSEDETVNLLMQEAKLSSHVHVIPCSQEHELLEKYYEIVMNAPDNEVIVHLYGTDFLAHDEILSLLSQSYAHPDVWLTYGQYLDEWSYERGINDPKPKKTPCKKRVQKAPWVVAPLKTYYAGLFKKLHVEEGFFLSIEDEGALLNPMAELAKAHVRFIPDVLFIHSEKKQHETGERRLAVVANRFKDPIEKTFGGKKADLVLFSNNTPSHLKECLKSCGSNLVGIDQTIVIYDTSELHFYEYEELKKSYPAVSFIHPSQDDALSFKRTFAEAIWGGRHAAPYVLLSTDQVRVQESVTLSPCIEAMRKAGAYAFYFHLGKEEEKRSASGIYTWTIRGKTERVKNPDALQFGLYRRLDLERDLRELIFNSPKELVEAWAEHAPSYRIGLSFEKPCATIR